MYIQWSYHLTNLLIHVMPQMLSVGDLFKPSREIPFNPQHFSSLTRKYNHKFLFFIYLLHFPHPKPIPAHAQLKFNHFAFQGWCEGNSIPWPIASTTRIKTTGLYPWGKYSATALIYIEVMVWIPTTEVIKYPRVLVCCFTQ